MTPSALEQLSQQCVLKMANSPTPGEVLAEYFDLAYALGRQAGIVQASDSLDTIAKDQEAGS